MSERDISGFIRGITGVPARICEYLTWVLRSAGAHAGKIVNAIVTLWTRYPREAKTVIVLAVLLYVALVYGWLLSVAAVLLVAGLLAYAAVRLLRNIRSELDQLFA